MSLDFDVSQIDNYKEVTTLIMPDGSKHWHPTTEAIVHLCMVTNIGSITEANWEKWFTRCRLWESAFGPMLIRGEDWEGEVFITPEEVRAHIGLWTNVADMTDAEWRKHFMNNWTNEVHWRILKDKN